MERCLRNGLFLYYSRFHFHHLLHSQPTKSISIRASADELQLLNGVGPSTANAIVDYREQNGAFASVEDLVNVKGIGEKKGG